jgi:predicted amidophosphoribosyltransferase
VKILAAREYAGDVVKWVWGAKYKGTPRNGIADAIEAVESFADYPVPIDLVDRDLVIPVPGRIGGKTYELSPRLASAAASRLDLELRVVLERTREAPPMRHMGPEKRRANVKGLYRVTQPAVVKGRRILVVDDVSTTGATLEEIERVLLKAGAADVVGLVLAKVKKKPKKERAPVAKKKAKKKARPKAPPKAPPAKGPAGVVSLFRVDLTVEDEAEMKRQVRQLNKVPWIKSAMGYVLVDGGARVLVHVEARDSKDATELVAAGLRAKVRRRRR